MLSIIRQTLASCKSSAKSVLIIPDMSENAVSIILNKIPFLISLGINVKIWDMTEGKTDEQLKFEGIYNNDLEDVFREINTI